MSQMHLRALAAACAAASLLACADVRAAPSDSAPLSLRRDEAAALEAQQQGAVIGIHVDCCEADAVERAVGTVYAVQAAGDYSDDVPVFITAHEAGIAWAVAQRLAGAGMHRVYVITDD